MKLNMPAAGEYLMSRCSLANIQSSFPQGLVTLPLLDRKSSCKYQYFIKTSDGKKYSQVFLRNVYDSKTVLIARPAVTRTEGRICISADPVSTTFLSIDDQWSNQTSMCASGKGPFKIRVWTTKRNYFEIVK